MRKIYTLVIIVLFMSCGTHVRYLGSSFEPTEKVDVFVTRASVNKPYQIIGKGYIERHPYSKSSVETIQKKAVEKAKFHGANAVVIEDYYVLNNGTTITSNVDTIANTQTTHISPTISSGLTILFLKYNAER
jgi:hypothetical protein